MSVQEAVDQGQTRRSFHEFLDESREWRRLFAELWGTFLLVLVAAGADVVMAASGQAWTPWQVVAPGIMVMAIIYFMGTVSGAHLNPAVTLAFSLRRNFPWKRAPGYIVAQLLGAVLASFFLKAMFGHYIDSAATFPRPGFTSMQAFWIEVVITAGLVNVILGTATGARNVGTNGAIAVGGYIALAGVWADRVSGASMNPARTIGPDLVRGDTAHTWVYIGAPLLGAVFGVVFETILVGPPTKEGSRTAQGSSDEENKKA